MRIAAAGAALALLLLAAAPAPLAPAPASSAPAPDSQGEVRVRVEVPVRRATVGDRLTIRVRVLHPASIQIDPPIPQPEEGSSLVLESVARTGQEAEQDKDVYLFQAQAFETGSVRVPASVRSWRRKS